MGATKVKEKEALDIKVSFEKEVEGHSVTLNPTEASQDCFIEAAEVAGIDKSTLKKVSKFANAYAKEALAVGVREAAEDLQAHKTHTDVTVNVPFGLTKAEKVITHVIREREFRNPSTGQTQTAPALKVVVNTQYSSISKGYSTSLRKGLAETLAKGK